MPRAAGAAGVNTISSQALAEQFHLNAAQIRKDLAYFGEFGVRGVGYYVKDLQAAPAADPRPRSQHARSSIIGAGNLGLALADYSGLPPGRLRHRRAVRHGAREGRAVLAQRRADSPRPRARSGWSSASSIDIAVMAVPAESAQEVVDAVVAAGVKAILNFSPGALRVPPRREAEERGPDRLAREPVVLPRAMARRRRRKRLGARHGADARRRATGRVRMVDVGDKP